MTVEHSAAGRAATALATGYALLQAIETEIDGAGGRDAGGARAARFATAMAGAAYGKALRALEGGEAERQAVLDCLAVLALARRTTAQIAHLANQCPELAVS